MPVIERSSYVPPVGFSNPHAQIIFASAARAVPLVEHERETIPTPDGDVLQLDWVKRLLPASAAVQPPAGTLLILHGLESHARLGYVTAMALAFLRHGWEVAGLNFRDCGDTPNRLWQSYHSGISQDVHTALEHLRRVRPRRQIALVGFSLGGNVLLRYLGAHADEVPPEVGAAVAISAPVDITCSAKRLSAPANAFYNRRFLSSMRWKLQRRCERFPGMMDTGIIPHLRTFEQFDEYYTAPAHGYRSAAEYWKAASSAPHLGRIRVPTLLLNAKDDPFLGPGCYPGETAATSEHFYLETPAQGSHVAFVQFRAPDGEYWHEVRAREFVQTQMPPAP